MLNFIKGYCCPCLVITMNIAVIGTGYVGLITGTAFASKGHQVTCVDVIQEKVEKINKAIPPIYEKGLEPLLQEAVNTNHLRATTNLHDAVIHSDIIFICVGTPSLPDGSMDYSYVKSAAKSIAQSMKDDPDHYRVIVVKSTCIPGTTDDIAKKIIEKESGLKLNKDFGVGMNPEFLREGVALEDFLQPDRIVIGGSDEKTKQIIAKCYEGIDAPILYVDNTAAEMIKYASNSFLAMKISFINEMANLAEKFGVDVVEVAEGIGLDHRISDKFLRAGAGFGGSCFPKDVSALLSKSKELGRPSKLLQATLDVNRKQPLILIDMLKEALDVKNLSNLKIAVLGLAFKPDTDDIREAPSLILIKQLLKEGAYVKATDPIALENTKKQLTDNNLAYFEKVDDTVAGVDACILITEWKEYKELTPDFFTEKMQKPVVIDGRRAYDYNLFRSKGIIFRAIGLGK